MPPKEKGPCYIDLTGHRYARLLVLKDVGRSKNGTVMWLCKCDCGKETIVWAGALKSGNTKSCGCLWRARDNHLKHGAARNGQKGRLYNIWQRMKQRCSDTNSSDAKYYAKNGIKVCKEWLDFVVFRSWALTSGYTDNLTIDRIKSERGYEPSNCQWIPRRDNAKKAVKRRLENQENLKNQIERYESALKLISEGPDDWSKHIADKALK